MIVLFLVVILLEIKTVLPFPLMGGHRNTVHVPSLSTCKISRAKGDFLCSSGWKAQNNNNYHRHQEKENDENFEISNDALEATTTTANSVSSQQKSETETVTTVSATDSSQAIEWEVYVDQSKSSLDKGGSATLDAFVGLSPSSSVMVRPALLSLPKSKAKGGPFVRCIYKGGGDDENEQQQFSSFDVANVDSVDKVHRLLTRHMQVKGVSVTACDCLKWKLKGNGHLESGNIALAVEAYNNALATGWSREEGIVLLMRATAYMQRASLHKQKLKDVVNDLIVMVPPSGTLTKLFEESSHNLSLSNSVFRRVITDTRNQEKQFRRTQYWHGLYQYSLLHAAQDSLRATQLLPQYATAWVRAGNILSELWKLKESAQYYEYAVGLDESLANSLLPVIDRLAKRQELLDSARAYGWSEDTLRLALDVTG